MLTRRLPKNLRTVFFALGLTMLTAATAFEHFQADEVTNLAKEQLECRTHQVAAIAKALLTG